jgi:serine/threonine protein kinase
MPDVIARKYQIVREIARSNDVVYEAIDTTMGRRLAVKELVIPANLTGQGRRERIERFNREARAAGKLAHPNIVTVYDYGEDNGRYFIAMEYLEGGTLRDMLQTRGSLPIHEAVDIAGQVLSALAHAHAHQVVHRDVKPDNMHILPGGQVKLTDFGIARLTEEASLTGEGQVFGTPSYMSPEQIKGQFIDHRSDLFSLSIVLYEMLAGRKPFTGDSVISITYAIMESQPGPIQGIPFGLEQAIFRGLNKDSRMRFSSADEMRMALKNSDQLASQPSITGMGGFGGTMGGFGGQFPAPTYGSPNSAFLPSAPMSRPPSIFGVSLPPPAPATMGSTVFAPPPVNAPPTANGQAAGPFVNWSPNGANPAHPMSPPPPPFPRQPAGPMFSEATKTFFKVLLVAVILGGAVLGGILLFQTAYEKQKKTSQAVAIEMLNREGKRRYEAKDYSGAIAKYEEALKNGAGTPGGDDARASLVAIYNKIGIDRFEHSDYNAAEQAWFRAHDLDPANEDVTANLGKLYDRVGDRDNALREWKQGRADNGSRLTNPDPSAPGDNNVLENRAKNAMDLYNQGLNAFKQGNVDAARGFWEQAVGEAPGTDAARMAKQMMDQTSDTPHF